MLIILTYSFYSSTLDSKAFLFIYCLDVMFSRSCILFETITKMSKKGENNFYLININDEMREEGETKYNFSLFRFCRGKDLVVDQSFV